MYKKGVVVLTLFVILLSISAFALDFTTLTVESSDDVGSYSSLYALDANNIFISYSNGTIGDLKFANSSDGGTTWTTMTVDSAGTVGESNDIYAVDANTIFISYYNNTGDSLWFANSSDGGETWTTTLVESLEGSMSLGTRSSIYAVDADTIYIAYQHTSLSNLKFANSSDGGETWNTIEVDGTFGTGTYSSISAINSTLFASYLDGTNGDLKVANSSDGGGTWTLTKVDEGGLGTVGEHTSIYMANASHIFVSYYDAGNGDLKFAKSTDRGESWTNTTVESTDDVGLYTSISATDGNTIYISYHSTSITASRVKLANSSDGGSTWTIQTVDSDSSSTVFGKWTSLDTVGSGTDIYISYYNETSADLMFAEADTGGNTIIGTAANVTSSGLSGLLTMKLSGASFSHGDIFNVAKDIEFFDDSTLMLNISHNFSVASFDLTEVTIEKSTNGIVVNVSDQLSSGETKTMFLAGTFDSVCVKDAEIASVDDISSGCYGGSETEFTSAECTGAFKDAVNCTLTGSVWRFDNLSYSGVNGNPTPIPEFSTITLLLALVIVVSGFVTMRKRFI